VRRIFFHALANVVPYSSTQKGAYGQGYSVVACGKVSNEQSKDPDQDGPESAPVGALFRRYSGRLLVLVAVAFAAGRHMLVFDKVQTFSKETSLGRFLCSSIRFQQLEELVQLRQNHDAGAPVGRLSFRRSIVL
jgi:hypothetical protein